MAYTKKIWKDYPDTTTPILAEDLNNIENGIETLDIAYSGLLDFFYPVGTIYETTSTNLDTTTKMANHFGGTWELFGTGRITVGYDSSQTEFNTIGKTGGAKTHILTVNQLPKLEWKIPHVAGYNDLSGTGVTDRRNTIIGYEGQGEAISSVRAHDMSTGGGQPHNNLQPYIVVYRYRRIS